MGHSTKYFHPRNMNKIAIVVCLAACVSAEADADALYGVYGYGYSGLAGYPYAGYSAYSAPYVGYAGYGVSNGANSVGIAGAAPAAVPMWPRGPPMLTLTMVVTMDTAASALTVWGTEGTGMADTGDTTTDRGTSSVIQRLLN